MTGPDIPTRMGTMSPTPDRHARIEALLTQLRPAAEDALRRMAEQLVDRPDTELFGDIEYRLRDAAHDLATTAHQTGLEARKKGGTRGRASCARSAGRTPGSTPGGPAGS
ncbi:N-carbamoylputrescine amidase / Omega amidase [Fimbriiglobus ruber]|uniref:N-carbamoylputrescine amidase / Omega amidase n=1 Tax=Fimbriiglobus ruber TaxID=1908690 RepID=A0A225DPK3_9BACT|nr:N-carbamoylputrescine amidase / Omega amidase [Fimbriiglobus ruber]OWK35488.1 N-carbamoylputrescine amidase / Omega amidase [Fimbriiglobus ruber]OWK39139.1 N-carbamoylputrescine amidase / Omega amidase [Fimbriiglobus ruber]OWK40844.1 N-carbamoylputrescine amidase / Omega amidase [Fimbriiglobus ruber]